MIELIIINSLIIWGVYASLQKGFIFDRIGNWIRANPDLPYDNEFFKNANDNELKKYFYPPKLKVFWSNIRFYIKKPLATCPVCMSSVYGTPVFWLSYYMGLINFDFIIIVYICYIFAIAGLNYLILTFMPE